MFNKNSAPGKGRSRLRVFIFLTLVAILLLFGLIFGLAFGLTRRKHTKLDPFRDNGVGISKAGSQAESVCEALANSIDYPAELNVQKAFSMYYPEGSMPSLETLTNSYPRGIIPKGTPINSILHDVGPDVDLKSQMGYGRLNDRASNNGPTGGLPAFCRFGAKISTSSMTSILSEVWLPLESDPSISLAPPPKDYPTATAPYTITENGTFVLANGIVKEFKQSSKGSSSATSLQPSYDFTLGSQTITTQSQPPTDTKTANKKRAITNDTQSLSGDDILGQGKGWNGRIAVMGHGGQLGFVPMPSMKNYMGRYMFAVAGTNLGHFSGVGSTSWVEGSAFNETLTDFASRANHLTLLLAENVVNYFYGVKQGVRNSKDNDRVYRYYYGSSVGGARGLSAAQVYPQDFNGIVAGAPAVNFTALNIGQLHTSSVHDKVLRGDGFFSDLELWGPIKDAITAQCDGLDGVIDGIISAPQKCIPQLDVLQCGTNTTYGKSFSTCLTPLQISTAYQLFNATVVDGQEVYPAYWPGLADSAGSLKGTNGKASGWYQLVTLQRPKTSSLFNPYKDIRLDDIQKGNAANPGLVNAVQTDLSEFVKNEGKLILYHGTYDLTISPQSTVNYFTQARNATASAMQVDPTEIDNSMKFYLIYGMRHTRQGVGAINFGGAAQNDAGSRPYKFESAYDISLAIIAWAEKSIEPNTQVAARYQLRQAVPPSHVPTNGDGSDDDPQVPTTQQVYAGGLINTRLLCPYPLNANYQTGQNSTGENGYQAFQCS
ncbi:hypothetical protein L7F22_043621 [Adiantum nelumboides]|nr:hypothetical protein [Adiantum nelumboides]